MDRRRFLTAITGLVSLGGCSATNPWDNPPIFEGSLKRGTVVRGATFEGVIFGPSEARLVRPFVGGDVAGFWAPTEVDVKKFESSLVGALEKGRAAPESLHPTDADRVYLSVLPEHIDEILQRLSAYRRQYFGVVGANGARRLFTNFFRGEGEKDRDWTTRYVFVFDGGTDYWRIQYDLVTGQFMQFNTNGFA